MSEVINKINAEIKKYENLCEQYSTYVEECNNYIEDLKVSRKIVSDLSKVVEKPKKARKSGIRNTDLEKLHLLK